MFRISRPAAAGVAGVVTAAFLSLPAMATPIEISQQVSGGGDNVFAGNGHKIVNITSPSDADGNVYAGAFALSANELGGNFIAWCLDIYDELDLASNYQITTTPFSDLALSAADQADIKALFDTSFFDLDLSSDTESAGFQVALWEIAFEGDGNTYDAATGDFAIASSSAIGVANGFLDLLGGPTTGNYELTFLESDGNSQDLVTASVSAVPLPASGLMLMGALAGLGLLSASRRRAGSAA